MSGCPGEGGKTDSLVPQSIQITTSGGLTFPHFLHLFCFLSTEGEQNHIVIVFTPFNQLILRRQ